MLHSNPKTKTEYALHVDVLASAIAEAINAKPGSTIAAVIARSIEPSGRPELGELAFKTFALSKALALKPIEIAAKISDYCRGRQDLFHVCNVALPYVNFVLNYRAFSASLMDLAAYVQNSVLSQDDIVVVEHTQPNTHKELHVGHLRNTILGDAVYRMLRPYYRNVFAVDYHGDEGVHVARTIWYIKKHKVWPQEYDDRGAWLGEIYSLAVAEIEAANGTHLEKVYYSEVSNILRNIESRHGGDYELWRQTRHWSISSFEKIYEWLDVHFDGKYSESAVSEASQRRVDEFLTKGVFINSEGAIGCDLREFNLGFCMLRKSDGTGLYATKDVELAIERHDNFNFNTCIYVVDMRQRFHFQQVFHTLRKMGFAFAKYCVHLSYDIVQTKEGTISSRRGARFSAQAVTKELEAVALTNINSRWGVESAATYDGIRTAHAVALAAMRYGMLKVDPEKKIMFDLQEWLSPEGNTGPYLLYTYARIASLLLRAKAELGSLAIAPMCASNVIEVLEDPRETAILGRVLDLPIILREAAAKLRPSVICNHAYEVAQMFNSFYNQIPILTSKNETLRVARLSLCEIVRQYLLVSFDRLGIEPVDRI